LSKYADQHQRMITVASDLFEFTLIPEATPIAIAKEGANASERLWEIALERRRHLK
jgi:hypothetical protein